MAFTSNPITTEEIEALEAVIAELAALDPMADERIEALRQAWRFDFVAHHDLPDAEVQRLYQVHRERHRSRLFDHMVIPIETRHLGIRAQDQNMGWQIATIRRGMEDWFERGHFMPPHYSDRVAVLLRRAKLFDLERSFIEAYLRHFWSPKLATRAAKIGVQAE